MSLQFLDAAAAEVEAESAYYNAMSGALAEAFSGELEHALQLIEQHPTHGSRWGAASADASSSGFCFLSFILFITMIS